MAKGHMNVTRDVAKYFFWTLVLQGISFVLLGILVLIYPAILFALVAANFVWMGITTLFLAWRVHRFRGVIPELFA